MTGCPEGARGGWFASTPGPRCLREPEDPHETCRLRSVLEADALKPLRRRRH
jgi:hypothetical protein